MLYGGEVIGWTTACAPAGSHGLVLVTSGLSSAASQARAEVQHAAGVSGVELVMTPAVAGPAVEAEAVKVVARNAPQRRHEHLPLTGGDLSDTTATSSGARSV